MKKNILILTTPFRPNVGGVETHLDDLIDAGVKKGYRFTVLTYQPLITATIGKYIERSKGLVVFRIPWFRMNLFLILEKYPVLEFLYLFPPLFIAGLLLMLRSNSDIKLLHSQGLIAGAVGIILGRLFNIPCVVSTHSIYNFPKTGLYRSFVRFILQNCTKVLALSKQSAQEIIDLGILEQKVEVFTYWVNQSVFKKRDRTMARKRLKLPADKFICLFVGRLVEVKGVMELLRASQITSNKRIIYLIAGDGPLASVVESEVVLNPNLLFKGRIDNKKLSGFYNAADVLIVPSIHEEGLGRVILEALSSGLPVVASNRGGIKEIVTTEVGILIKISPKKIKEVIEWLARDKNRLQEMQSSASKYAKIHFSKKNSEKILKIYG